MFRVSYAVVVGGGTPVVGDVTRVVCGGTPVVVCVSPVIGGVTPVMTPHSLTVQLLRGQLAEVSRFEVDFSKHPQTV